MMSTLRLIKDRLLIRQIVREETEHGIWLTDAQKSMHGERGLVLAAGPDVDSGIRIGDTILYSRYAGVEATLDGERLLFLRNEDVYGALENANQDLTPNP